MAGEILGKDTRVLGKSEYTYPVVLVKQLHLWKKAYYKDYEWPWYAPDYYDPFYGPYYGGYYGDIDLGSENFGEGEKDKD